MNTYSHLANTRSLLVDKFYALQSPARRDSIWAKLFEKNTTLPTFPEQMSQKSPNRKLIGVKDIPVEQIVGTLNRDSDFDHKFRPLKSHLRDRWVNVCIALENGGWDPIVVHKIGEQYYVEDGHHRVSVAHSLGMAFIEAKVWEYPGYETETVACGSRRYPERESIKACAAD